MTDDELEERMAQEMGWQTPEGCAEIARQEAEVEAVMKEGDELEAQIRAYLEERYHDGRRNAHRSPWRTDGHP
jgi:hypothetical protein